MERVIDISAKLDLGGVFADLNELETGLRERAAVSAINKTLAQGRTQMTREIAREFNLPVSFVRERLNIVKAKWIGGKARLAGALDGSNGKKRSANLIAFLVKSVTLAQARKRMAAGEGGTYQLRNGATVTKALELQFKIKRKGGAVKIPGAFIGNKGRTVFKREGAARLPIKALSTIGIPQMFNTKRLNKVVVKGMETDFPGIFEHELKYFTDRFNQRRARGT